MAFLDDTQVPPARSRVEQLLLNAQGGGGSDSGGASGGDSGSFDLLSLPYVQVAIGNSMDWHSAELYICESYGEYIGDASPLYTLTNESHLDGTLDQIINEFIPNNPVCIVDVGDSLGGFLAADRDLHLVLTNDLFGGSFARLVQILDPENQVTVFYMLQAVVNRVGENNSELGISYSMTPFDSSKSLIEGTNAFYSESDLA